MLKANPKPNTPAASPPDVDECLSVFYRGKLNHGQDGEMKQVQTALLNATGTKPKPGQPPRPKGE